MPLTATLEEIALSRLRGMTAAFARELAARGVGPERFFELPASALSAMMSFKSKLFDDTLRRDALEQARRELEFIRANGIRMLFHTSDAYPKRLLECEDAPAMLYCLGDLDLNSVTGMAIVGTRRSTAYGNSFTQKLVGHIAGVVDRSIAIVSGLAYGIDVAAHRAALDNELPTVAILAHGLNMIYPSQHRNIAAEIVAKGGALLTEYCSIDPIHKGNFLARNRIVAGISDAVVVAESDVKGGAMFTARIASDYGRDVFALPGRLSDKYSTGCNKLISDHLAAIVTGPDELIAALGWPVRSAEGLQQELFKELNPLEQQVVDLLTANGEMTLSELRIALDKPLPQVMALLIDMEFRKLILSIPGSRYSLA